MTVDEQAFTPWAAPGWQSWDAWSAEVDFCRFAGLLQRMLQPGLTVETGVGVGRVTQYLDLTLGTYYGFESDPAWLRPPADAGTPDGDLLAKAELVILDSDVPVRIEELNRWAERGQPHSACLMHDTGNGHALGTIHAKLEEAAVRTGIPGLWLRNPRGSWLGVHP